MSPGKTAAQAGHAYLDAGLICFETDPERFRSYKTNHGIKICLKAKSEHALRRAYDDARRLGIPCSLITDLGYTVFEGKPTITALGIGPARRSEIESITKRFNLLA